MPEPAAARPFCLYIVRCADDTLYTGIAIDVDKRIAEHVAGRRGAKYLRGKGPVELVFRAEVGDRSAASRLEYRVKRLPRQDKEALIRGNLSLAAIVPTQVLDEDCS